MLKNDFLRNLKDQLYLVWDTETEGLNLVRSRPWQISYHLFKGNNLLESHDRFVWYDDLDVSPEAAKVTGFNYLDYKEKAENPAEVFTHFSEYLDDESVINVGHNILGFDIHVDQTARSLAGVKHNWDYLKRSVDTLCLARGYKNEIKPNFSGFLAWQFSMLTLRTRGNKLAEIAKQLGIEFDEKKLHDANFDTLLNYKVFRQFLNTYDI